MKKYTLILSIACMAVLQACKKDKKVTSEADLIRDSIFLYTKESYYWNDQLPSYDAFAPRSYNNGTDEQSYDTELNKLATIAINPATGKSYEFTASGAAKYSFLDDGSLSASLGGTNGDFGFSLLYNVYNDLRVKYVYAGSPAATAGLVRGYKIIAVNGSTSIAYDPNSADLNNDPNLKNVVNALGQTNIKLTLQRPDGTTFNADFNRGSYKVNPVLKATTVDAGNGHIIGYLAFNSFTVQSVAQPILDPIIADFVSKHVTDLVVDLRYNGGGAVATARYLSNLLAPTTANGKPMYTTYFNSNLTNGNTPVLANQKFRDDDGKIYSYAQISYKPTDWQVNFNKTGNLNVGRVFFIVTGSTASASELTINNLRPYMNVQLIGRTTYGKPVGFFSLHINKYTLYTPQFETKNAAGQGGYYTGMVPGSTDYPGKLAERDDVTKDWGDPSDRLFAYAVAYVKTGTYGINNLKVETTSQMSDTQEKEMIETLSPNEFKGMVLKDMKLKQ